MKLVLWPLVPKFRIVELTEKVAPKFAAPWLRKEGAEDENPVFEVEGAALKPVVEPVLKPKPVLAA